MSYQEWKSLTQGLQSAHPTLSLPRASSYPALAWCPRAPHNLPSRTRKTCKDGNYIPEVQGKSCPESGQQHPCQSSPFPLPGCFLTDCGRVSVVLWRSAQLSELPHGQGTRWGMGRRSPMKSFSSTKSPLSYFEKKVKKKKSNHKTQR